MTGRSDEHLHMKERTAFIKVQLDRTPRLFVPLISRVSGVITRNPKCNGGPWGPETETKLMKKLMSTCNDGGCDFHSIQGGSADKRLRGNRRLSFIGELRQEGMVSTVKALRGNGRRSLRAMVLSHSTVCLAPRVMTMLSKTRSLTCAELSAVDASRDAAGQRCT